MSPSKTQQQKQKPSFNPNAARNLLSSNYRIFNPHDVGDRFVAFLLRNERTMSTLYNHVLMDHLTILRQELQMGGDTATATNATTNNDNNGNENHHNEEEEDHDMLRMMMMNLDGLASLDDQTNNNLYNNISTTTNDNHTAASGGGGGGGGPKEKTKRANASIEIDAFQLLSLDPVLGNMTLRYPDTLLELLEDSTVQARQVLRGRMEVALEHGIARMKQLKQQRQAQLLIMDQQQHANEEQQQQQQQQQLQQCNYNTKELNSMTHLRQALQHTKQWYDPRPLHARLVHLPPHHQCCKPTLSAISSIDVGTVVQISGTCVRAGPVRMMETIRSYICLGKGCGHRFSVSADFGTANNALPSPTICPRAEDEGDCHSTSFALVPNGSEHADYQEMKVQESVSALHRVGSVPRSILIKLSDDLVDRCNPGDEVVVVGSLHAEWLSSGVMAPNLEVMVGMSMRAHSVRVINIEEEEGGGGSASMVDLGIMGGGGMRDAAVALASSSGNLREKFRREFDAFWSDEGAKRRPIATRDYILRAVCPKLYGMHAVKLGLLLVMIGGATVSSDSGLPNVSEKMDGGQNMEGTNNDDNDDSDEEAPATFKIGCDDDDDRDKSTKRKDAKKSMKNGKQNVGKAVRSRRRIQSHILLIGDPGTGKSQFLRFAAALSPRSVLTTGTGSSTAGLTCAAVRDASGSGGNEFSLEAGALALADRGVCCIDEFGCMSKEDRTSIHEAMEQQTISVAKAGIICKLNARATVVAVMNPHGGIYDETQSLSQNSRLGSALLSRFDLIFVMLDQAECSRDENIADFLLQQSIIPGSGYDRPQEIDTLFDDDNVDGHWSMEKLRAYIATVRKKFHPTLTPEASELLENHYSLCRQLSGENKLPVTVRFLESLIRLSQAHARLMYRNTVTLQDAAAVILLMECTATATSGGFGGNQMEFSGEDFLCKNPIDTEFLAFDKVDAMFEQESKVLLRRYANMSSRNDSVRDDSFGGEQFDEGLAPIEAERCEGKFKSWDDVGSRETQSQHITRNKQVNVNNIVHRDQWGRQMMTQPTSPNPSSRKKSALSSNPNTGDHTPAPFRHSNSHDVHMMATFSNQASLSPMNYPTESQRQLEISTAMHSAVDGNVGMFGHGNRVGQFETRTSQERGLFSSHVGGDVNIQNQGRIARTHGKRVHDLGAERNNARPDSRQGERFVPNNEYCPNIGGAKGLTSESERYNTGRVMPVSQLSLPGDNVGSNQRRDERKDHKKRRTAD